MMPKCFYPPPSSNLGRYNQALQQKLQQAQLMAQLQQTPPTPYMAQATQWTNPQQWTASQQQQWMKRYQEAQKKSNRRTRGKTATAQDSTSTTEKQTTYKTTRKGQSYQQATYNKTNMPTRPQSGKTDFLSGSSKIPDINPSGDDDDVEIISSSMVTHSKNHTNSEASSTTSQSKSTKSERPNRAVSPSPESVVNMVEELFSQAPAGSGSQTRQSGASSPKKRKRNASKKKMDPESMRQLRQQRTLQSQQLWAQHYYQQQQRLRQYQQLQQLQQLNAARQGDFMNPEQQRVYMQLLSHNLAMQRAAQHRQHVIYMQQQQAYQLQYKQDPNKKHKTILPNPTQPFTGVSQYPFPQTPAPAPAPTTTANTLTEGTPYPVNIAQTDSVLSAIDMENSAAKQRSQAAQLSRIEATERRLVEERDRGLTESEIEKQNREIEDLLLDDEDSAPLKSSRARKSQSKKAKQAPKAEPSSPKKLATTPNDATDTAMAVEADSLSSIGLCNVDDAMDSFDAWDNQHTGADPPQPAAPSTIKAVATSNQDPQKAFDVLKPGTASPPPPPPPPTSQLAVSFPRLGCKRLLKQLMQLPEAYPFNAPVAWKKLNIPTYPLVIRKPMDLRTVFDRLEKDYYGNVDEFTSDMRLIWSNARTFNPKGHHVHNLAVYMSSESEKQFAMMLSMSAHGDLEVFTCTIPRCRETFKTRQLYQAHLRGAHNCNGFSRRRRTRPRSSDRSGRDPVFVYTSDEDTPDLEHQLIETNTNVNINININTSTKTHEILRRGGKRPEDRQTVSSNTTRRVRVNTTVLHSERTGKGADAVPADSTSSTTSASSNKKADDSKLNTLDPKVLQIMDVLKSLLPQQAAFVSYNAAKVILERFKNDCDTATDYLRNHDAKQIFTWAASACRPKIFSWNTQKTKSDETYADRPLDFSTSKLSLKCNKPSSKRPIKSEPTPTAISSRKVQNPCKSEIASKNSTRGAKIKKEPSVKIEQLKQERMQKQKCVLKQEKSVKTEWMLKKERVPKNEHVPKKEHVQRNEPKKYPKKECVLKKEKEESLLSSQPAETDFFLDDMDFDKHQPSEPLDPEKSADRERVEKELDAAFEGLINPLPNFVDPYTSERVATPAMSPDGYVLSTGLWD